MNNDYEYEEQIKPAGEPLVLDVIDGYFDILENHGQFDYDPMLAYKGLGPDYKKLFDDEIARYENATKYSADWTSIENNVADDSDYEIFRDLCKSEIRKCLDSDYWDLLEPENHKSITYEDILAAPELAPLAVPTLKIGKETILHIDRSLSEDVVLYIFNKCGNDVKTDIAVIKELLKSNDAEKLLFVIPKDTKKMLASFSSVNLESFKGSTKDLKVAVEKMIQGYEAMKAEKQSLSEAIPEIKQEQQEPKMRMKI